ncbi:MAG: aconitate hydratase AcnA [Dehalococcoidia bacterium]|nr:aconitate hydratase AcnA [Dehalococcoidia bacterium]
MTTRALHFGSRTPLRFAGGTTNYYRLQTLEQLGLVNLAKLPVTIRIMLENILRNHDGHVYRDQDVETVAKWNATKLPAGEVPFMPSRVVLQDLTGVPAVVDLAAMRSAMKKLGGDPRKVNPGVPCDLVIDHSVQVDFFGTNLAYERNVNLEYQRNTERYLLLRWAQSAFQNFRLVPPGTGIVHQVNLEYLASVVDRRNGDAFFDTLVGTDSHTPMVNGLGVVGWGVGGIEAEAAMLGQPFYMNLPEVIGMKLTGTLKEGVTATDLVLTVTEILRKKGVVEKFVEFYGTGLSKLPLADRATISNMAPEYGATVGYFPIDQETLNYLRATGRSAEQVDLVERYAKEQGVFRTDATPDPEFSDKLELDLGTVVPSLAGPRRPQDRVALTQMKPTWRTALTNTFKRSAPDAAPAAASTAVAIAEKPNSVPVTMNGKAFNLKHGDVAIAAITSCTNTSNPSVMVGAGLVAKKAIEKGLSSKPWVKTSMAPGSRVVDEYLKAAGVLPFLEQLGFNIVGYGCTTCIGNSGPLPAAIDEAITKGDLVVSAVASGNRNFEGRIHPMVKANYLASPMLVVAYALAGTVDFDLENDSLGAGKDGKPVYLKDIWPTQQEIAQTIATSLKPEMFQKRYGEVFKGDNRWQNLPVPLGELFKWDYDSTYVQEPPYFDNLPKDPPAIQNVVNARPLAILGDSITTDHISPAGAIPGQSPAAKYLREHEVESIDFNTFGARRGNDRIMVRGTFGNIRLRNEMVPNQEEGDWTVHQPSGQKMRIFDASMKYKEEGVPLIIIAGKEYGSGSSRDWAAKGPNLLGVKAVIAESFERIHRSNLIGMGILPMVFKPGENRQSLKLAAIDVYTITDMDVGLAPNKELTVNVKRADGTATTFHVICRLNTPVELEYYRNGGVLHYVLRKMLATK